METAPINSPLVIGAVVLCVFLLAVAIIRMLVRGGGK